MSYVQDLSLSAGEPGHILFGEVSGSTGQWPSMIGDRPPVSLFCRMPPGASILKIEATETGLTDA